MEHRLVTETINRLEKSWLMLIFTVVPLTPLPPGTKLDQNPSDKEINYT